MAKTREEIDELIRQHEEGTAELGKDQILYEIRYIVEFIIFYITISFLLFTAIATLLTYMRTGAFILESISLNAQYISGTVMLITGMLFFFSYLAGVSAFCASMTIRAWSGNSGNTMNDQGIMQDMQNLMNPGEIIKGLLLGSIVTLLFYYLYIDQTILG